MILRRVKLSTGQSKMVDSHLIVVVDNYKYCLPNWVVVDNVIIVEFWDQTLSNKRIFLYALPLY